MTEEELRESALTPGKVAEFIGKNVLFELPNGHSMSGKLVMVGYSPTEHFEGPHVIAMLDYGYGVELDTPGLVMREGL